MRALDHGRIRGAEFRHLKGVARLLRIASFIENARPKTFREAKKLLVQHFFKGDALSNTTLSASTTNTSGVRPCACFRRKRP